MITTTIPKILRLEINKPISIFNYFSLGEVVNGNIFASQDAKYKVSINFVEDPLEYIDESLTSYSSYYKVGKRSVLLERKYSGLKCKLLVKGMDSNIISLYMNNTYYRLIRFKLDNLYPPGLHANDIIMTKILRDNDLIIHGASFQNPQTSEAFAVIAPPDTGKTFTAYKLLELGYKFLGEDLSYYSSFSDSLVCMPYTSTWGHHFSGNKRLLDRIPFLQLFAAEKKATVVDLFGKELVSERAKLKRIYLIEKSSGNKIQKIEPTSDIIQKVKSIQRNEFSYFKNPLLRAYEYFNHSDIDSLFSLESKNTEELLKAKQLFRVQGTNYDQFFEQIDNNEKKYV